MNTAMPAAAAGSGTRERATRPSGRAASRNTSMGNEGAAAVAGRAGRTGSDEPPCAAGSPTTRWPPARQPVSAATNPTAILTRARAAIGPTAPNGSGPSCCAAEPISWRYTSTRLVP